MINYKKLVNFFVENKINIEKLLIEIEKEN